MCSVGKACREACSSLSNGNDKDFQYIQELDTVVKEELVLRLGTELEGNPTICHRHKEKFILNYCSNNKKCCDPYKKHKKAVRTSLKAITLGLAKRTNGLNIHLIPGQKMCPGCRVTIFKGLEMIAHETSTSDPFDDFQQEYDESESKIALNDSLLEMEISPVKAHSLAPHSRVSYVKRKMKQIDEHLEKKRSTIRSEIATTIKISNGSFTEKDPALLQASKELEQKGKDLDCLVELMREKLPHVNNSRKIQILTMVPPSWSIKKAQDVFRVSDYMIREARKLVQTRGIMELPEEKHGKNISNETEELVRNFYCDDEFSRQMPGKKDFLSVSRNLHMQKRLLLCGLKELYSSFKQKFPDVKVGFSKFCSLRPKWCVLVGSSGTHSVWYVPCTRTWCLC